MKVFDGHFPETKKAWVWKSALWTGKIIKHILSQPLLLTSILDFSRLYPTLCWHPSILCIHFTSWPKVWVSRRLLGIQIWTSTGWPSSTPSFWCCWFCRRPKQSSCCWPMVFPPTTWRIIPVTQWLIDMVSKFPWVGLFHFQIGLNGLYMGVTNDSPSTHHAQRKTGNMGVDTAFKANL